MNAFVAITDRDWFDFRAGQEEVDEVNLWQPSAGGGRFRALGRGHPFLFKLRAPTNAIVGGGFFEHYPTLPFSLAWRSHYVIHLAEIRPTQTRMPRCHSTR